MLERLRRATEACDTTYGEKSPEYSFIQGQKKRLLFILLLIVSTFFGACLAVSLGAVDVPLLDTIKILLNQVFFDVFGEPSESYYTRIIIDLRLPRVVLCILAGASLGMAGAVMQGLLRNPLVSPFTLGVSTAASFGAALAIVFGTTMLGNLYYESYELLGASITLDDVLKTASAFSFGLFSISLILLLTRNREMSRSTVILSGVIISYIFQAGLMFLKYVSDDSQLRDITMWMMGGLSGITWNNIMLILPIVIICAIYLMKVAIDVNMLSSGDEIASNLGIDVTKLRNRGLIVSTLMTTICIAFTGTIGFVGLMAPHLCRMIIGNDSRYLFPASAFLGSFILMVSDVASRLIMRPSELPIGIIMYIIGGIFFIWLVFGKKLGGKE